LAAYFNFSYPAIHPGRTLVRVKRSNNTGGALRLRANIDASTNFLLPDAVSWQPKAANPSLAQLHSGCIPAGRAWANLCEQL